MKGNRTILSLLAVLVITALTLAGCGGGKTTPATTTTPTTTDKSKTTKTTSGSVWRIQTIDDDKVNVATATAISAAIDTNNAIHVIYSKGSSGLKYATNKTGTWISTYIQKAKDLDIGTGMSWGAMAVDGNNNVHVVYLIGSIYEKGEDALYYATDSSGSWIKTKIYVDPRGGLSVPGIITTSNGKVHLAFSNFDTKLIYLNNISGSWSAPIILGSYWPSVSPRLALNSNGDVYIAFNPGIEQTLRLQVVNSSGSLVSNKILDGGEYKNHALDHPNIAIDKASNSVYVSYVDYDNTARKLYSPNGIVTIAPSSAISGRAGIALDKNGKVHMSFTDGGDMFPISFKLKYATNKSGSWVVEELPTIPTSSNADIVIESTGKIDIVYAVGNPTSSLNLISR